LFEEGKQMKTNEKGRKAEEKEKREKIKSY